MAAIIAAARPGSVWLTLSAAWPTALPMAGAPVARRGSEGHASRSPDSANPTLNALHSMSGSMRGLVGPRS